MFIPAGPSSPQQGVSDDNTFAVGLKLIVTSSKELRSRRQDEIGDIDEEADSLALGLDDDKLLKMLCLDDDRGPKDSFIGTTELLLRLSDNCCLRDSTNDLISSSELPSVFLSVIITGT
jgi:hypothetical protein